MKELIETLHLFAEYAGAFIEYISILIIMSGVAVALWHGARLLIENGHSAEKAARIKWIQLRLSFEDTLMLGLQFLMAADIIGTISNPDLQGVVILSVIVLLRVILSFTLAREVAEMDRQTKEAQNAVEP